MAPFGFPVLLELGGRKAVVLGALPVAEGKVEALVAGGATDVLVVAEGPVARLATLEGLEGVRVERRGWRPSDLDGVAVAIAHDDDQAERDAMARAARDRGVPINVVDDVPNCDWAMPSIVRRGDLVFAVGTGGASPALSKRVRRRLEETYGPEWSEVLRVLREVREATLPALPDLADRARRWADALDPDEAAELVRQGRSEELRTLLIARLLGTVEAS